MTTSVDRDPYGFLNLNQSQQELAELYGPKDYYYYLRSTQFKCKFLRVIGDMIRALCGRNARVLDVACGEGQLSEFTTCRYTGFDGSPTAIDRAKASRPSAWIQYGRMENPPHGLGHFNVVVFGGVLEVLIRPERRVDFVNMYRERYEASHFIVYDLERLDTGQLEIAHRKLQEVHDVAEPVDGMLDIKRYRKVIGFEYLP